MLPANLDRRQRQRRCNPQHRSEHTSGPYSYGAIQRAAHQAAPEFDSHGFRSWPLNAGVQNRSRSSLDRNIFTSVAVAFKQLGYGGMLTLAGDVQGLEDVFDGDPVGDVQFALIA